MKLPLLKYRRPRTKIGKHDLRCEVLCQVFAGNDAARPSPWPVPHGLLVFAKRSCASYASKSWDLARNRPPAMLILFPDPLNRRR